jgi:hypothetical protein
MTANLGAFERVGFYSVLTKWEEQLWLLIGRRSQIRSAPLPIDLPIDLSSDLLGDRL